MIRVSTSKEDYEVSICVPAYWTIGINKESVVKLPTKKLIGWKCVWDKV